MLSRSRNVDLELIFYCVEAIADLVCFASELLDFAIELVVSLLLLLLFLGAEASLRLVLLHLAQHALAVVLLTFRSLSLKGGQFHFIVS